MWSDRVVREEGHGPYIRMAINGIEPLRAVLMACPGCSGRSGSVAIQLRRPPGCLSRLVRSRVRTLELSLSGAGRVSAMSVGSSCGRESFVPALV